MDSATVISTSGVAQLARRGDIGILTIDSPPVNALSQKVCAGLYEGLNALLADAGVRAIVLTCAGRTFFAGADISEFNKPLDGPDLYAVLGVMEGAQKPIIAALFGTALGGGLEVALAAHYRVASQNAMVGLPEVQLGLLPGAGGTQRLPRLVGAAAALEMIGFGKPVGAGRALALGVVDEICAEGAQLAAALAFARRAIDGKWPLRRVQDDDSKLLADRGNTALFAEFRKKNARAFAGFKAPENIVKAIEAAVALPFAEGMKREAALFGELVTSDESEAQRYVFFAERAVSKIPGLAPQAAPRKLAGIGVVGAGTMGGGIAMACLDAGYVVTLVEQTQEALARGLGGIRRNYQAAVDKGRLSAAQLEEKLARLTPVLEMEALRDADLIIEAVFERMEVKTALFAKLDAIAKPSAVLASNTSFLDLNEIAAATRHPERVVGLHFFSPANVMKLLEIVRGAQTGDDIIATAMAFGRKLGKIAVLAGVCHGFIANRAMHPRTAAAEALILEGPLPWDVDRALMAYGFPMGVFSMMDLVGLDVIGWDAATSKSETVQERLCEAGRWGQKRGGGYYDYDEKRVATPSPVAARIIHDVAAARGMKPRGFTDEQIIARLLYPVVNESAKLLEEGIALRASDIDIALIYGYGWPVYRGGPMMWADQMGLAKVVAGLEAQNITPCAPLREAAATGRKLHTL